MPVEFGGVKISWLGHDAFRLKDDKTIYIDPYKIKGKEMADIILITHEHFDHLSVEDINKVSSEKCVIVAARSCANQLGRVKAKEIKYVKPGDELEIDGVKIKAVYAYNVAKPFHPKDAGGVG
ncbi:MAG: MBL fold metallo-hydrolase, partial [Nitrososphaerota archaeon]